MELVWFDPENQLPEQRGQPVLVVFLPSEPRSYKRQIRTAIFFAPDEWFVHGGSGDCGYYDRSKIERWTFQPEIPGKEPADG